MNQRLNIVIQELERGAFLKIHWRQFCKAKRRNALSRNVLKLNQKKVVLAQAELVSLLSLWKEMPEKALALMDELLLLNPFDAGVHSLKGICLLGMPNDTGGLTHLGLAAGLNPNDQSCLENFGKALKRADPQVSLTFYKDWLEIASTNEGAVIGYADALLVIGDRLGALQVLEEFCKKSIGHIEAKKRYAGLLIEKGCSEIAATVLNSVQPKTAEVLDLLGRASQTSNQRHKAVAYYREAACLPGSVKPGAWRAFTTCASVSELNSAYPEILSCFNESDPRSKARMSLGFALGNVHIKNGRSESALKYYQQANSYIAENFKQNMALWSELEDKIDAGWFYSQLELQTKPRKVLSKPVFIVGSPRSGSSVLEERLSRHSNIQGLGELIVRKGKQTLAYQGDVLDLNFDTATFLASYERELTFQGLNKPVFIDKQLFNVFHLGRLVRCFPNCLIIATRRDLYKVIWSCFRSYFDISQLGLHYTADVVQIAKTVKLMDRVIDTWMTLIPDNMMLVEHDDFCNEPISILENILSKLDLKWEPEMGCYRKQVTSCRTLSSLQVSEPISNYRHQVLPEVVEEFITSQLQAHMLYDSRDPHDS